MKYFTDKELRCKCCGQLPPQVRENLMALVDNILDPVREKLGRPVYITSPYRCLKHNTAVGSKPTSQHIKGEACDVYIGTPEENITLARLILENGKFDQMILYTNSATSLAPRFIHVSYKRFGENRHRILKQVRGTSTYTVVSHREII